MAYNWRAISGTHGQTLLETVAEAYQRSFLATDASAYDSYSICSAHAQALFKPISKAFKRSISPTDHFSFLGTDCSRVTSTELESQCGADAISYSQTNVPWEGILKANFNPELNADIRLKRNAIDPTPAYS